MKPFARGWLGLKCMAEKCENPIPWQEMEKDASSDEHELETIKKLENDCAELCVSAAGLYLQRCPKCNCAVEMDGSNDELKFHCPECKYDMCRKCNEKWADEHNHLTCEQFAKQQNREGYLSGCVKGQSARFAAPKGRSRSFLNFRRAWLVISWP
ncbi:hypothetical protein niasHS_004386 [Heterodera schachtii]|uniref:RING-type domain-containing protein n=1 Tax=Heterodera schachtii TaxID=97005 RepID=A0ABD2K1B3_HETSC